MHIVVLSLSAIFPIGCCVTSVSGTENEGDSALTKPIVSLNHLPDIWFGESHLIVAFDLHLFQRSFILRGRCHVSHARASVSIIGMPSHSVMCYPSAVLHCRATEGGKNDQPSDQGHPPATKLSSSSVACFSSTALDEGDTALAIRVRQTT